jgi:mRNA interferase MazF
VICEIYSLVAVPFPFMERPAAKRRPALVLSARRFNARNAHTIMAMVTTARGESWPDDYRIMRAAAAGLKVECFIRWKVFTLPNVMIAKLIGRLGAEDMQACQKLQLDIMDLASP